MSSFISKFFSVLLITMLASANIVLGAEREPIIVANLGPQVGEQVPDFQLSDQFGEIHDLESVMGPNGAMLLFHRSADW
ncbi:MAG TPA: hypothetical protein DCY30_05065 [Acidimicrobiaceae bacterium]|jgi:hypothetical protein|nr:hypothetical protein [Acidimicrobiaceae bacterium]